MSVVARQGLLDAATPRPWRQEANRPRDIGTECDEIAVGVTEEADAALIVAAVNEYGPLLACEAGLRSIVCLMPSSNGYARHAREALEQLDKIRAT